MPIPTGTAVQSQINGWGKVLAGALLIGLTTLPFYFIIGLWPNQMPTEDTTSYYRFQLFAVDIIPKPASLPGADPATLPAFNQPPGSIHINTILFALVALAGFMGSMIHLATSFTNYVGARSFRRDWTLWYCVKPFTAAGVAIIFFMVLNAGLLNYGSSGSVNPFGVVVMAALAGLFTDKATLKLEEIFSTIFKPKDSRPDTMESGPVVDGVTPTILAVAKENPIQITGKNLDKQHLNISMDDVEITTATITPTLISFGYRINAEEEKSAVVLSVRDAGGAQVYSIPLTVEAIPPPADSLPTGSTTSAAPTSDQTTEEASNSEPAGAAPSVTI